jgi:hypothetical protein
VHIQLFWILHICNIQYILRWNAIYFLCEKRHLHGLFGCWSFRNWRHLSHFCCKKQYKTNLHCLKWRLFRKLQQPKGPWRWRYSQINRRTRRTTRSTSSNRLKYVIPKCRTTTYQKSFLVRVCRVWNYLADELNLTKDTSLILYLNRICSSITLHHWTLIIILKTLGRLRVYVWNVIVFAACYVQYRVAVEL